MQSPLTWYTVRLRKGPLTPERLRKVFGGEFDPDVLKESFVTIEPCRRLEGQEGEATLGLLHVGRNLLEGHAVAECLDHGLLPRLFTDLVDLAEDHPEAILFPIVSIGSLIMTCGHSKYACIWGSARSFKLHLLSDVHEWGFDCRFLVSRP